MSLRSALKRVALLLCIGSRAFAPLAAAAMEGAQIRERVSRLAQIGSAYPLLDDDGERVPNHRVEFSAAIDTMPGVVVAANPQGQTTLVEFYDLNCPYCRIASNDIADMVAVDPDLRLVLFPYPVLGPSSVSASRVEVAVAQLGSPQQFYGFQSAIFAEHRSLNGAHALDVAERLGLDKAAVMKLSNSDEAAKVVQAHVEFGKSLGLEATPSFIIGGVAIVGYPGRHGLQNIVDAVRACGKVFCQE